MLLIIGIFLIFFLGLIVSLFILKEMNPIERIGLSYLLGLGVTTILMFFLLILRGYLTASTILVPIIIFNLSMGYVLRKKIVFFIRDAQHSISSSKLKIFEKQLLFLVIFLNFYCLIMSLYWPIKDWDAIALYDFRGKFLTSPILSVSYMKAQLDPYYYGYPLLTSLSHSFVYLLGGQNPLFLHSLFYIALTSMFYGVLRRVCSIFVSLVAVLLLLSNVLLLQHASVAYINLPYAVYYSMGTIYLYLWMVKRNFGYFIFSCILTALSIWVRDSEPFWIANLAVLIIYAIIENKIIYPLIYFAAIEPVKFIWNSFKDRVAVYYTNNEIRNSISIIRENINLQRLVDVINFLRLSIMDIYLPILLLFAACLLLDFKNIFKKERFYIVLLIISNFAVLFVGTYAYSFVFKDWLRIPGSVTRIFMFFPAIIIFYIAIVVESLKKKHFKE